VQRLNRQDADAMTAKIKKNDELIDFFQRWNQVIQRKESDVSPKMVVFFDGVPFEAKLVHLSERFDMAILKIDRPRAGPFFRLCAENKIEQGEPVVILGYPGLALLARSEADQAIKDRNQEAGVDPEKRLLPQDFIHSETRGYVTRNIEDSSRTWSIEHDARTSGGNSGGPVVIKDGSVVGIHSAGVPGEGVKLNFAYSVAQFRKEIDAYVKSSSVWK
jgi:S1-C subfamily serine protease